MKATGEQVESHSKKSSAQLMEHGRRELQAGRHGTAISCFAELSIRKPNSAIVQYYLANAFQISGQAKSAEAGYRRVLELDASFAEAHNNLGVILRNRGLHTDAIAHFQAAIKDRSDYLDAIINLANAFQSQRRDRDAINVLDPARTVFPEVPAIHDLLGKSYRQLGKLDLAVASCRRACELSPDSAAYVNSLGIALQKAGATEAALEAFRNAIRLDSQLAETYLNIGVFYFERNEFGQAEHWLLHVLSINPEYATAHYNVGRLRTKERRFDEALAAYAKAISLDPDFAAAHHNRALLWLLLGNFADGWPEFEWRWRHLHLDNRVPTIVDWNVSALNGKNVFVEAEQGVGDQVMFASCLSEIMNVAEELTIECDAGLVPLFQRSFASAQVVERQDNPKRSQMLSADDAAAVRLPIGSLPRLVRPIIDSFPIHAGYLIPDSQKVARWESYLSSLNGSLKVGISWKGGGRPEVRQLRSTQLKQWLPVIQTPGISFICLQHDARQEELLFERQHLGVCLHHFQEANADLDSTCALIAALDLVISIDNTTAHLAGAMGRPVWTLLSAMPDWRWLLDRDDSPWYPSMKLFRQATEGNWDEVFERVAYQLRQFRNIAYIQNRRQLVTDGPAHHIGHLLKQEKAH